MLPRVADMLNSHDMRAIEKQVSILGSSYFQPIADLIERWLAQPRPRPNAVQSGYSEAGYAASVVLSLSGNV